jgi:hypothetical protein
MTEPTPPDASGTPRPRGAHRAVKSHRAPKEPTQRGLGTYLTIGGTGLALVLGGLFALVALDDGEDAAPVGTGVISTPGVPLESPTPTPSTAPETPATEPESEPTEESEADTEGGNAEADEAPAPRRPVVVLNGTQLAGLAADVAGELRSEGWTVTSTANWTGANVPTTTVFFQPGGGNKASAERLDDELDVVVRVRPALDGMTARLTVVTASDAA